MAGEEDIEIYLNKLAFTIWRASFYLEVCVYDLYNKKIMSSRIFIIYNHSFKTFQNNV